MAIPYVSSTNPSIRSRCVAAIDAPEKEQAYGSASKKSLSDLVYKQIVSVEWDQGRYSYDRIVGKVMLHGRDINLLQVQQGMAWYCRRFADEQSAEDRVLYAKAEDVAKVEGWGLWRDDRPTPPWAWRNQEREKVKKTQDAFHKQWLNRNWQFR